jgi:hypothetical protein
MKRTDLNYLVSLVLLVSICVTALLGTLQAQLELRRFVPHRYAAYITLAIVLVHVLLNGQQLWRYLRSKLGKRG